MNKNDKPIPLPPADISLFYAATRLVQSELNAWVDCGFAPCRKKSRCLGGPRGTCRKTGGFPLCSEEGRARETVAGGRKVWAGEGVPEEETISERRWRRFSNDLKRWQALARYPDDET